MTTTTTPPTGNTVIEDPPMEQPRNPQRRRFLRTLGVGTAAAGTAAAIGNVTFVQAENESQSVAETSRQYRETDHIRAFYATLRD